MAYPVPAFIPPYGAFVLPDPPVIPKLYWGALTQEERIRKLCQELHRICEYANQLGIAINLDHEIIKQLEEDFEPIRKRYGLKKMPHLNSSDTENWMGYYTRETAALVYKTFKRDFIEFGYEESYSNLIDYINDKSAESR